MMETGSTSIAGFRDVEALEIEALVAETACDLQAALDDLACEDDAFFPVPLPPPLGERPVLCKECAQNGDRTTMMVVYTRNRRTIDPAKNPPITDRITTEIALVGEKGQRTDPGIEYDRMGRESRIPYSLPSSRIDPTASVNIDEMTREIRPKCHRCGHSLPRGLGKRALKRLLSLEDEIFL